MRVQVEEQRHEYEGFFQLDEYKLRLERFDGKMTRPVQRLVFERGDSAAVLLHDSDRDVVVLVEQFRFPAYLRERGDGLLLEIVAGTVEAGRSAEDVARSEIAEEAGYTLEELQPMGSFYVSPGACTERIFLYLAQVRVTDRTGPGGGVGDGESVRIHEIPVATALRWVQEGKIRDAKTIIALQYLALTQRRSDA